MRWSDGARGDPLPFGLHADDLAVRVLCNLTHERRAVVVGHPVVGLDPLVGVDECVELCLAHAGSFCATMVKTS